MSGERIVHLQYDIHLAKPQPTFCGINGNFAYSAVPTTEIVQKGCYHGNRICKTCLKVAKSGWVPTEFVK